MNKKFYSLAIFFVGLSVACGLLQSIVHMQIDRGILGLQVLPYWLLAENIIILLATIFILKYYHTKSYKFTFYAGAISGAVNFVLLSILYIIIVFRQLNAFYPVVLSISLVTGLIYGISLASPPAGRNFWLRIGGFFLIVSMLATGSTFFLSTIYRDAETSLLLQSISQWTSLFASLTPVTFILLFLDEIKLLKETSGASPNRNVLESTLNVVAMISLIFATIFGAMLVSQAYTASYWEKQNAERAQVLAKLYEARNFVGSAGDTLRYRLLKPLNYDPQQKYPLVVSLHHGGVHGTDNFKQLSSDPSEVLTKDGNRKSYPTFVFAPQCPEATGWGGIPGYPAIDSLVFEAMEAIEKEFSIDSHRRYVAGVSGGGYGSWYFISTRPQFFAAAIPICGGGDVQLAKNIVGVKVWAFHGEKDNLVPVKFSRDLIESIKSSGGDPKYTEYPGEGHNIAGKVMGTPGLLDWLFEQRRDSVVKESI